MDLLALKLGKAITQKNKLLELLDSKKGICKLDQIDSKEQNYNSLNKIKEDFSEKSSILEENRNNINKVGNSIAQGMSEEKLSQLIKKQRQREESLREQSDQTQRQITRDKKEIEQQQKLSEQIDEQLDKEEQNLQQNQKDLEDLVQKCSQTLQEKDNQFQKEMKEKEDLLQQMLNQLKDLKNQIKDEKTKQEKLEEEEEDLDNENERLVAEIQRYDEELDEIYEEDDQDEILKDLLEQDKLLEQELSKGRQQQEQNQNEIDDLVSQNKKLKQENDELDAHISKYEEPKFDIDQLQDQLSEAIDQEKKLLDEDMNLLQKLKEIELQQDNNEKENNQLQNQINKYVEQNQLEKKLRKFEIQLSEFEDRLRNKRRDHSNLQNKIDRVTELLPQKEAQQQMLHELKGKLSNFESEIDKLSENVDNYRQKKQGIQDEILDKDISQIEHSQIKQYYNELLQLQQSLDRELLKENDVYQIYDRCEQEFSNVEKNLQKQYKKKCEQSKKFQDDLCQQLENRLDQIIKKTLQIEEQQLPSVSKIADDKDEIDILNNKIDILKDVKRSAKNLDEYSLKQCIIPKLKNYQIQDSGYISLIEQFNQLKETNQEVYGVEKQTINLEKRLDEFEQNLKQFEYELKKDFYQDSIEELKEHKKKVQKLDKQLNQLNQQIQEVEQSLFQIQQSDKNSEEIGDLENTLEQLRNMKNKIEKEYRELKRDNSIVQSELQGIDLNNATPEQLDYLNNEINKQQEQFDQQEQQMEQILEQSKQAKEKANQIEKNMKLNEQQKCKKVIKELGNRSDEIDRILNEICSEIEIIEKDYKYLKETDWSPTKKRQSSENKENDESDLEKVKDLSKQKKAIQQEEKQYEQLRQKQVKLNGQLSKYDEEFRSFNLESAQISDFQNLSQVIKKSLDEETEEILEQAKKQLDDTLKDLKKHIQDLIDKYKQKRALYQDCKKKEAINYREIQKIESQNNVIIQKLDQMSNELISQNSLDQSKMQDCKSNQVNKFKKDIEKLREKVNKKQQDVYDSSQKLKKITNDLNKMDEHVLTVNDLKTIYKELTEIEKLKQLKDDLKQMLEEVQAKEQQVQQFIKELIGGNIYEAESKLKEAELKLDKLAKLLIEDSNFLSKFESEVKEGLRNNLNDEDIQSVGQQYLHNIKDKEQNFQKSNNEINAIRQVLLKIKDRVQNKNQANEEGHIKASDIAQILKEIETCIVKTELNKNECDKQREVVKKDRESWNQLLFNSGTKSALVEDIETQLNQNLNKIHTLNSKFQEIDKLKNGLESLLQNIQDNPDYESRQAYIKKQLKALQNITKEQQRILTEKMQIEDQLQQLKKLQMKGFATLSEDELKKISKEGDETEENLTKLTNETNEILNDLKKRRQKLADADIIDNFKERVEKYNGMSHEVQQVKNDQNELQKIIEEMKKINPNMNTSELQLNNASQKLQRLLQEKDQLGRKLTKLKEEIKKKDLNRDDPITFIPIIQKLRECRQEYEQNQENLSSIGQEIKTIKNKLCGDDIQDKIDQYLEQLKLQKSKLDQAMSNLEDLKHLNEYFDGYTSDNNEEDFIERLGIDVRTIGQKHKQAYDQCDKVSEEIKILQKKLERSDNQDIDSKEIEERAMKVSQIEEELLNNQKRVKDIEQKINKHKQVFMGMQSKEKLRRRQLELMELNKKLEQFINQASETEVNIQNEINNINLGNDDGDQLHNIMTQLGEEIQNLLSQYDQEMQTVVELDQEVQETKNSNLHQYEILKSNIDIKKRILKSLENVKTVRQSFVQLKAKFQMNKPKKQEILYRPIKGDYVDQLLAEWVNNNGCPVPIKRMGNGYYIFGTKKIYAKIINGKLVIRVGGGYMGIDEFMFYYGAQELNKILAYEDAYDEEVDLDQALTPANNKDIIMRTNDGKGVIGIQQMKKRLSPRPGSPHGQAQQNRRNAQMASQQQQISPRAGSPKNTIDNASRKAFSGRRSPPAQSFLKNNIIKQAERSLEEQKKIDNIKQKKYQQS